MPSENGVLFQSYHYQLPKDCQLWRFLAAEASSLSQSGFSAVWFPPPYKGSGGNEDVGYSAYDLFDLGEFDQKKSVATKYGRRHELEAAIGAVQQSGMQAYVDVVFNHKIGGDDIEETEGCEVRWNDRNSVIQCQKIKIWSHFHYKGRRGANGQLKHSTMVWHWYHFDSTDWDQSREEKKLYRLKDKHFETEVSPENGNFDFLMGADVDTSHPEVDGEFRWWGRWIVDTLNVDGFRIDAVKHIRAPYFRNWINHLRTHFSNRNLFAVGEYWTSEIEQIERYLAVTQGTLSVFDVPLHQHFRDASVREASYDMRDLLPGTVMQRYPSLAVTFVDNHDTQPGEDLESWVEPWFKPLAYAFILLRGQGYPCVFYGDYYGATYTRKKKDGEATMYSHRFLIDKFMSARRSYGYGDQHDYIDHQNTIGWTRLGNPEHPGSMAVVMTNGSDGHKWMNMFRPNTEYFDVTDHYNDSVFTNDAGWGNFPCRGRGVSVWLQR